MLSLSFSSFMLVLVMFILLHIKDTIAHTDKVKQNFVINEAENGIAKSRKSYLNVEKEALDDVPTSLEVTSDKFGGRKRLVERRNMRQSMKKMEGIMQSERQGKLTSKQNKLITGRISHAFVKVNRGNSMPFSADYSKPRTHPPKNN